MNLINTFHENITYYIFCSNADVDGETVTGVAFNKWVKYNSYTSVYYVSKDKRNIFSFINELKKIKPQVIYINGIYSWYFNLVPLLFATAPRKIISVRGMLHPGALSQKKSKKYMYLLLWKIFGLQKKIIFHATNEQEKQFIATVFGKVTVYVAPNFPRSFEKQALPQKKPEQLSLISIALISPMKNILLALRSLEKIQDKIDYHIYGSVKDKIYWNNCQEQMKRLPACITTTWHGDVTPADVIEKLSQSHVFILPSKSENFGHAIYEALSAGRPVITSEYTPWKNLKGLGAGMNVSIDNSLEMTDAIHFFAAMNKEELVRWSNNAHKYAVNAINVDKINQQYEEMFSSTPVH